MDYRGKASASMIYDQKPIIDIFRKIDEDTMLGVMDIKISHLKNLISSILKEFRNKKFNK